MLTLRDPKPALLLIVDSEETFLAKIQVQAMPLNILPTRACLHLSQGSADKINAYEKVSGSFLIARYNTSEVFSVIEEALFKVALGIERKVAVALNLAI